GVAEAGNAPHLVVTRDLFDEWEGDLSRWSGHEDALVAQGRHRPPLLGVGTTLPKEHRATGWWPNSPSRTVALVFASLFAPWSSARWRRAITTVILGSLLGPIPFPVTIALLATGAGLAITFPLALPFAWLLFVCVRGFGRLERSRLDALLDVSIADPHAPLPE